VATLSRAPDCFAQVKPARCTDSYGKLGLKPGQARLAAARGTSLGVTVWDLFYVGLTIVVFAVLLLILKGVERFER